MADERCPCGSGKREAACCAPYHAGAPAPTALALMRSRYTAYVRGDVAYLLATQHASTRDGVNVAGVEAWARGTEWQGLEIVAAERGGAEDDAGVVEFVARGVNGGRAFAQHERSRFVREEGRWYYVDGDVKAPAPPGRNEPCPCGSGKKFKKCHGA